MAKSRYNVVTGAASGLGLAISRALLDQGERVIGLDLDTTPPSLLGGPFASNLTWLRGDLRESDTFTMALHTAARAEPASLRLYLCAGVAKFASIEHQSELDVATQVQLNLTSRIEETRLALQWAERTRAVVQVFLISSSTAIAPIPDFAVYSATTAGLLHFARAVQREARHGSASVVVVVPDGMQTDFQRRAGMSRAGSNLLPPSRVAEKILGWQPGQSETMFIGAKVNVARFLQRALPTSLYDRLTSWLSGERF